MEIKKRIGLCHRCNFRAVYLEEGYAPRLECKANGAVVSCYSYKPVEPVVLHPNEEDYRPILSGIFSARSHGVRLIKDDELQLSVKKVEDGYITYYSNKPKPKEKEKVMATSKKTKPMSKPTKKKGC